MKPGRICHFNMRGQPEPEASILVLLKEADNLEIQLEIRGWRLIQGQKPTASLGEKLHFTADFGDKMFSIDSC